MYQIYHHAGQIRQRFGSRFIFCPTLVFLWKSQPCISIAVMPTDSNNESYSYMRKITMAAIYSKQTQTNKPPPRQKRYLQKWLCPKEYQAADLQPGASPLCSRVGCTYSAETEGGDSLSRSLPVTQEKAWWRRQQRPLAVSRVTPPVITITSLAKVSDARAPTVRSAVKAVSTISLSGHFQMFSTPKLVR